MRIEKEPLSFDLERFLSKEGKTDFSDSILQEGIVFREEKGSLKVNNGRWDGNLVLTPEGQILEVRKRCYFEDDRNQAYAAFLTRSDMEIGISGELRRGNRFMLPVREYTLYFWHEIHDRLQHIVQFGPNGKFDSHQISLGSNKHTFYTKPPPSYPITPFPFNIPFLHPCSQITYLFNIVGNNHTTEALDRSSGTKVIFTHPLRLNNKYWFDQMMTDDFSWRSLLDRFPLEVKVTNPPMKGDYHDIQRSL